MSRLINFYSGSGRNSDSRTIFQIWEMSDSELMHSCDCIQWLFPLTKESSFNPDAPALSERDILLFNKNPKLKENLSTSFYRFLKVFGLNMDKGEIEGNVDTYIFQTPNHNWLRFSRIIESLNLLGLPDEARKFYDFIVQNVKNPGESLGYWHLALQ